MSNEVSLTGNDTVILDDQIIDGLADGDAVTISYPNEIATLKTGKNGNTIYALNESGEQVDVIMRVLRGSRSDKLLNAKLVQQKANFAGTVLMTGEFIKKVGNGQGKVLKDTYILAGGIFSKNVEAKSNAEGDTEQSIAIYNMRFANSPRALT